MLTSSKASFIKAEPALLGMVTLLSVACRPSPETFYSKIYTCDKTLAGRQCGTNEDGQPMTCFHAAQVGAQDYCTDSCDGRVAASSTSEATCLESTALLRKCRPSEDRDPASHPRGSCGRSELRCYRTDLLSDEGLCTTFATCSADSDCSDPARTTCASTILHSFYPKAQTRLQVDNLYCVQTGCEFNGSACPAGEVCLPSVLPPSAKPFDACVPKCDSNLNCPPNFFCLRKVSGPANPAVCLAGFLGFRCSTDNDCMLGKCVDTGQGFNVCSVPCDTDADCAPYDGPRGAMQCLVLRPDQPKQCLSAESLAGSYCKKDSDCLDRQQICTYFSPFHTVSEFGTCLLPCDAEKRCPVRAGVPHTCFDFPPLERPVCYPGMFGMPCRRDDACVAGLSCKLSRTDQGNPVPICTAACSSPADCTRDKLRFTSDGWCDGDTGVCVLPRPGDAKCTEHFQCASNVCKPSEKRADEGTGIKRCVYPAGEAPR